MSTLVKKFNVVPFVNPYTLFGLVIWAGFVNFLIYDSWNSDKTMSKLYLLMAIQLLPFLICFTRQHFDYIAFVMFNHFFTFSVGKLNQLKFNYKVDELYPAAAHAIDELTLCSVLLILGYYISRQFIFYRFIEKEKFQLLSLSRIQLMIVAGYVIFVPLFFQHLPSWLITMHFATMAADMVLLLCSNSPGNEVFSRFLRMGVAFSTVWYFLSTGFLTMVGNLAGYIFIASCLQKKYKQLLLPLVLGLLACLVQNVKQDYRTTIRDNPYFTVNDRIDLLGNLLYAKYVEDVELEEVTMEEEEEKEGISQNLSKGFSRAGDDSLEVVLEKTPKEVPFWDGESYSALPYIFIPRALWTDKPSRHIWNKFGRTYGFIGANDYQTSVGVSYVAEGYMNFGYVGMYSIALLVGIFIAAVERLSFY
ncbi:MAG: hypothetical protein ACKOA8_16050, partial [Deltaproteobacteria bacterium]